MRDVEIAPASQGPYRTSPRDAPSTGRPEWHLGIVVLVVFALSSAIDFLFSRLILGFSPLVALLCAPVVGVVGVLRCVGGLSR